MEPAGDEANRTSRRNEAFAFWNSFCICATWPGMTMVFDNGECILFRPVLGKVPFDPRLDSSEDS